MKKLAVILCALVLLGISQIQGQSFKIGAGGGLSLAQSPSYFEDYDMSTGYNIGVKAKLGLPLLPITLTGQISYSEFNGNKDNEYLGTQLPGEIETEADLLIMGVGAEYSLLPGPISPYLGADVYYSEFGNFNSGSTMGLGLGAGLDFKLLPVFDIDLSAKYNFYNLIGKDENDDDFNAIAITANLMFGF